MIRSVKVVCVIWEGERVKPACDKGDEEMWEGRKREWLKERKSQWSKKEVERKKGN